MSTPWLWFTLAIILAFMLVSGLRAGALRMGPDRNLHQWELHPGCGWPAVREANPAFVFDPVAINTLKAKNITFEATFSGFGNHWVGRP